MNANLASYDDKDTLKSESTVEFLGPPQNKVEFQEAISFVNKIKVKILFCFVEFQLQMLVPCSLMLNSFFVQKRFQNDEHVYKAFQDIMNVCQKEHKGITIKAYNEVSVLWLLFFFLFSFLILNFSYSCNFQ